jgi:hypothetical protein
MKYFKFSLIIFLIIISCSEENGKRNYRPAADFTFTDEIDHIQLYGNPKDIDGDILTYEWVSMCDTIKILGSNSRSASINLPGLKDTAQVRIKLVVSNGYLSDSVSKNITLPKYTLERIYGLGRNFYKGHSNNVSYDWYCDQAGTGTYSLHNCGPTSATMAIKWANENFNKTPEDARNKYPGDGGNWGVHDVISYLNLYSINNDTINITQIDSIQRRINSGKIVILCVDMFYIRENEHENWHVDKFYPAWKGWGHFIVIKGYKVVDNEVFYEAYDPYSFGLRYNNGTLKGKDRYYRSEDLNSAVIYWVPSAIIVSKSQSKGSN